MSCYSLDLRKRVIKYLKKGHSKKKASKVFQITTRTIYNWEKLDKKGELKPKNNLIRKPKKIMICQHFSGQFLKRIFYI